MSTEENRAIPQDGLLDLAWRSAVGAAMFLAYERPAALEVEAKSTPTDAVTQMDRGAEERIVAMIRRERPDDAILGEEGGARSGTTGMRWVIDPLDGTVNYLYDLPCWAVSVGVEDATGAYAGVVVSPTLGMAWVAVRDQGAFACDVSMNDGVTAPALPASGRVLVPSDVSDLGATLVATGFGYDAARRLRQGAVVADLLGQVRDIRRIGAATVDMCFVASGRSDAFFEVGLKPWDLCAASLIAREAGAVVRPIGGTDPGDGVLVSAPRIADPLLSVLEGLGAHRV